MPSEVDKTTIERAHREIEERIDLKAELEFLKMKRRLLQERKEALKLLKAFNARCRKIQHGQIIPCTCLENHAPRDISDDADVFDRDIEGITQRIIEINRKLQGVV